MSKLYRSELRSVTFRRMFAHERDEFLAVGNSVLESLSENVAIWIYLQAGKCTEI
jgi:hypothetical protein